MDEKTSRSPLKLTTSFSRMRSRSISDTNSLSPSNSNNSEFSYNNNNNNVFEPKDEAEKIGTSKTKRTSMSLYPEIKGNHSRRGSMLSQLSNHVKSYSFDTSLNNKNVMLPSIITGRDKNKATPENSPCKSKGNFEITSPVKASGVSGNVTDSSNIMLQMNNSLDTLPVVTQDDDDSPQMDSFGIEYKGDENVDDFWTKIKQNYPHLEITVLSILLWYVFSMGLSVYNRWMFSNSNLDFKFPILITSFHQLILTALAVLTLVLFPRFRLSNSSYKKIVEDDTSNNVEEKITYRMPVKEYLLNILPCSIASAGDIGLGNTAFRFITLSLYTMVKTSSLIFVLLWGVLLKLEKFTMRILAIVCIMTFGVGMMIYGQHEPDSSGGIHLAFKEHQRLELKPMDHNPAVNLLRRIVDPSAKHFVFIGVTLVLVSACMSGLRWALTQITLKKNKRTKNPILTMLYIAPGMSVLLFISGALVEGLKEFQDAKIWNEKGFVMTIILIMIPGFLAFFMTISELVLLQYASLLTLSIAGIFKELLTIFISWVVFGDELSFINIVGLVITFADIVWYNIYRFEQNAEAVQKNEPEENEFVDIELNSMYRED